MRVACQLAHRLRRRRWWLALVLIALTLLSAALYAYWFPQRVLTVESGPVQADAIVLLGGAWLERPQRAAELFHQGAAPHIIVTGYGDAALNQQYLQKYGVPAAAIQLETQALNTLQNARLTVALLRARHCHRAILVTSWYHSRRALACFQFFAPEITFYSRPDYSGYPTSAGQNRPRSREVKTEYQKLLGYWCRYGILPF